jgi:hypothetical protein
MSEAIAVLVIYPTGKLREGLNLEPLPERL